MLISKKSLIVAICLFIIAFKGAAGSIFVQSAIERAQLHGHSCMAAVEAKTISSNDLSDDQQPVHTMYLMYHVTANINDTQIHLPTQLGSILVYAIQGDRLYLDNIPDAAFKPPKYIL
jgi:hypothetical protein